MAPVKFIFLGRRIAAYFSIFVPMKRLLYLLPLYILLLSAMPCKDDDGCCKTGVPCSPFFACGACHGFIVPEETDVSLEHKEVPSAPKPILPEGNTLPGFSSFIWQPPRKCPENEPPARSIG